MKQAYFQLSPEKRDLILAAACAEFGAHDFDAASLDRIVSAAGISKGGLYEYIASKDDLYLYCMRHAWSSLYRYIESYVPASGLPAEGVGVLLGDGVEVASGLADLLAEHRMWARFELPADEEER